MWLRCRNTRSGHYASVPVDLVESGAMPDWAPIPGAEPTQAADEPMYNTTPQPVQIPGDTTKKEQSDVPDSQ